MNNSKKIKTDVSATMLIGIIFTVLGSIFLIIGSILLVGYSKKIDEDLLMVGIIFMGIGILFATIGIIFLVYNMNKNKHRKRLIEEGFYVMAEVTEISCNYNVQVNGRCPYIIYASYTDNYGNVHIFHSRNIFYNPSNLMKNNLVKVYVSRNENDGYKHYYMDIDEILPKVKMH